MGYIGAVVYLGTTQIISRLKIGPELRTGIQAGRQPQSYVCGDSASTVHNFENGWR